MSCFSDNCFPDLLLCCDPHDVDFSAVADPSNAPLDSLIDCSAHDFTGLGFIDETKGEANGLTSCTESLGFESCDERADDVIEQFTFDEPWTPPLKVKAIHERRKARQYPPPLSSYDHKGQPRIILKSVRGNGKLQLNAVVIERAEVFNAYREGGRLILHLIEEDDEVTETDEHEKSKT